MSKNIFLIASVIAGLMPFGLAEAGEGFSLSDPPAPIQQAWKSTVAVSLEHGLGSAVLVRKEERNGRHFFYFLTAGHLRAGNDWPAGKPVNPSSGLSPIEIFRNLRWQSDSPDPAAYDAFAEKLDLVWGILGGDGIDAGLLVFEAKNDIPELAPLPVIDAKARLKRGRRNYNVGFPSVQERPAAQQKVSIEKPLFLTKRWSEGFLTGLENPEIQLYGSTADTLHGQSGGPIVDEDGVVLGVLAVGNFIDEYGRKRLDYRGNDRKLKWQSAFYSYPKLPRYLEKQMKAFDAYLQAH